MATHKLTEVAIKRATSLATDPRSVRMVMGLFLLLKENGS